MIRLALLIWGMCVLGVGAALAFGRGVPGTNGLTVTLMERGIYTSTLIDPRTRVDMPLFSADFGRFAGPYWSSNGGLMAYTAFYSSERSYLHIRDRSGKLLHTLDLRSVPSGVSWSPNGQTLAIARNDQRAGAWELFAFDIANGVTQRLIDGVGWLDYVVWSPDADKVALVFNRELHIYSVATEELTVLTEDLDGYVGVPVWSPDGTRVMYTAGLYNQVACLYTSDVTTGHYGAVACQEPASGYDWSPDGTQIVFDTWRDGLGNLYIADANGYNLHQLTDHTASDILPQWSPDGAWIAFMSNRGGGFKTYLIPATGGVPRAVTGSEQDSICCGAWR